MFNSRKVTQTTQVVTKSITKTMLAHQLLMKDRVSSVINIAIPTTLNTKRNSAKVAS